MHHQALNLNVISIHKRLDRFAAVLVMCMLGATMPLCGAATASYNLTQLANTTVSSAQGQSTEGKTSPSVLLSAQSQWQPGYNYTAGGTNPYELVFDFQEVYDVSRVTMRTHFRGSQSLSQFYVEASTNGTDWTEVGVWNGTASSAFNTTFTLASPVSAQFVRYRVPAGQYTAVSGDRNYGGPGLHYAEILTPVTSEFSQLSTNHSIAYSALGGSVSVSNPPAFNRGNNPAVTNDGLWTTGGLGHNNAAGWGADAKVVIDVGDRSYYITGMELIWTGDRGKKFSAIGYTLESSEDGTTWDPVSFSINTGARGGTTDELIFANPFLAEYLRIGNLTVPSLSWDPTIGFSEILVYGWIPEPSTALLLAGAALVGLRRRRG